jgi:hypothetical protein
MIEEGTRVRLKSTAQIAKQFRDRYTPGVSVGTVSAIIGEYCNVRWHSTGDICGVSLDMIEPFADAPAPATEPDCRWCRGTGVLALFSSVGPCECR